MTIAVDKPGYSPLQLVRCRPRLLVNAPRDMAQVEPALVNLMRRLVEGKAPWPLYLHGQTGTGKTAAALALCDITVSAAYFVMDTLCSLILAAGPADVRNTWGDIEAKELVVLDELGTRQEVGDLHYATLKRVADAREVHAGRRAIYVSNLSPEEFCKVYDDRIKSRVLCGSKFELDGRDRRLDR
ncbi:MAG TPA: AAA family ATPase [Pirellulales bacterium]|nr:AAA family ATPase [Pirellulales bacterium]